MRFGRLTVLADTRCRKWGQIVWLCCCDCGKKVQVVSRSLSEERTRSCGCLRTKMTQERNRQNAWHDLRKEIIQLGTTRRVRIDLPKGKVTWRTKLTFVCPTCHHKRNTDVSGFLKRPLACRHCSRRMPIGKLRANLSKKMISIDHIEYDSDPYRNGQGMAHCECSVCYHKFSRRVGELISGNRGCPGCLNVQEMYVRIILTHNLGGAFSIRKRPKWMNGLVLLC